MNTDCTDQILICVNPCRSVASLLLVANCCVRSVEFLDRDGEWFIVRLRAILQNAQGHLFAQQNRPVSRAAKVYPGVDAVAERDIVSQLVKLAVNVNVIPINAGVGIERCAVRVRLVHIATGREQQRTNLLAAVEEEFQGCDASAAHGSVACRITRVRR